MTEFFRFNIKLAIFSVVTFLAITLPEMMKWKMVDLADGKSPLLLESLKSYEFQISLVVSLSMSAPMFFELLLRMLLYGKLDYVLPNILTLTTLALPDMIILCYVRTAIDLISLNLILQSRFILFSWLAFSFIKKYGGKFWSSSRMIALFILICLGRIFGVYKGYVDYRSYQILNIFGMITDSIACLFFPLLCLKWYYYLYKKTKTVATITNNQYMCNVYVTAYFQTCSGISMIIYTSPNTLDLMKWNENELTLHTLMYTVFYIIVIVFEGRVLQHEMLQAKVFKILN